MNRISIAILAASLACSAAARAQTAEGDCGGLSPDDRVPVSVARVAPGAAETHFVKNRYDGKACPSEAAACRARAYLVPGDLVLIGREQIGVYRCAIYTSAKGRTTIGWLPAARLEDLPPTRDPKPADWLGTWTRKEAEIKIAGAADGFRLDGTASCCEDNPEQVKRGNIRTGVLDGLAKRDGEGLAFAEEGDGAGFVEGGCRVRLHRVAELLLVEDNQQCGGVGVSFTGLYRRQP